MQRSPPNYNPTSPEEIQFVELFLLNGKKMDIQEETGVKKI